MITAHGRGVIAGAEEARKHASRTLTTDDIRGVARLMHALMRRAGYAHIDPEREFVDGFVVGFSNAQSIAR